MSENKPATPSNLDEGSLVSPNHELTSSDVYVQFFKDMTALLRPHNERIEQIKKEYLKASINIHASHPGAGEFALWVERTTADYPEGGTYFTDWVTIRDTVFLPSGAVEEAASVSPYASHRTRLLYETDEGGALTKYPETDEKRDKFVEHAASGFNILSQEKGATLDISIGGPTVKYISDGATWVPYNPNQIETKETIESDSQKLLVAPEE